MGQAVARLIYIAIHIALRRSTEIASVTGMVLGICIGLAWR
jgi:hypothetical protein